jgi:hypothetical protein
VGEAAAGAAAVLSSFLPQPPMNEAQAMASASERIFMVSSCCCSGETAARAQ